MSKLKSILMILLAVCALFSMAVTAKEDKKAEKNDFQLTGEAPATGGYKIYFNKSKEAYMHLWGFTRLYWFHNAKSNRLKMNYFRFYLDGQKNKNWQFHTRFDYTNAFHASKLDTNNTGKGAPSIYFARAYTTYIHNDNFKIDAGRILQQHNRFDVLGAGKYQVGLGVNPKINIGDFSGNFSLIYMDESQRMSPSSNGDASQEVTYGGRIAHSVILTKDVKVSYGLGYQGNAKDVINHFHQIMPDIIVNLPYDLYVFNQTMFQRNDKTTNEFQSYNEIGIEVTKKLSIDTFIDFTRTEDGPTAFDIGLECFYKVTPALNLLHSMTMGDVSEKNSVGRDITNVSYLEYTF